MCGIGGVQPAAVLVFGDCPGGVVIAVPDLGNEVKNGYFKAKIEGQTYRKTA